MAGWTEPEINSRISTALNDTGTAIWGTATISSQMELDVRLISDYMPQLCKAAVAFAGTARELDISGTAFADLLEVEYVEFPIDQHPRRYQNFVKRGSSVILDDALFSVSSSDTAYVWFSAPHTVSGTVTNTLNRSQELILIELSAAHLLQNLSLDFINSVDWGSSEAWRSYRDSGERREAKVMSRLNGMVEPNFNVRYPNVK